MPQLTDWLKLMISEIDRKRDDAERAREEETRREGEHVVSDKNAQVSAKRSPP